MTDRTSRTLHVMMNTSTLNHQLLITRITTSDKEFLSRKDRWFDIRIRFLKKIDWNFEKYFFSNHILTPSVDFHQYSNCRLDQHEKSCRQTHDDKDCSFFSHFFRRYILLRDIFIICK